MATTETPAAVTYFATFEGRPVAFSEGTDRRAVQVYVNRNNAAYQRRTNTSEKPYAVDTSAR